MQNKRFQMLLLLFAAAMTIFVAACDPSSQENSNLHPAPSLPFDLIIEKDADFSGGYTIREADGLALVGKGVTYRDIDLRVEKLVGYGVQKEALAAEVIDNEGATKFIKIVKKQSPERQPFFVSWAVEAEVKNNVAYYWVDLGKE